MAFELPPLPYAENALEPAISERTISFHYGKHHAAYVNNLNKLIEGTDMASMSLDEIIMEAEPGGIFNNAAQVWNHTFYWNCMTPSGGGEPSGPVADAIESSFGSKDAFLEQFSTSAKTNFGSGWTWLVRDGDGLAIENTSNADTPLKHGFQALLTIDVWEHAYYLDYQNARPAYVDTYMDKLVNWEFVNSNFGG